MTFAEQMETDLDLFFDADAFAQTVTYNGAAVAAIIEAPETSLVTGLDATACILHVRRSDVPSPAYRDTVVVADGDNAGTWHVYRWPRRPVVLADEGGVYTLMMTRDERPAIRAEGPAI